MSYVCLYLFKRWCKRSPQKMHHMRTRLWAGTKATHRRLMISPRTPPSNKTRVFKGSKQRFFRTFQDPSSTIPVGTPGDRSYSSGHLTDFTSLGSAQMGEGPGSFHPQEPYGTCRTLRECKSAGPEFRWSDDVTGCLDGVWMVHPWVFGWCLDGPRARKSHDVGMVPPTKTSLVRYGSKKSGRTWSGRLSARPRNSTCARVRVCQ